jgi:hypothetical protein
MAHTMLETTTAIHQEPRSLSTGHSMKFPRPLRTYSGQTDLSLCVVEMFASSQPTLDGSNSGQQKVMDTSKTKGEESLLCRLATTMM